MLFPDLYIYMLKIATLGHVNYLVRVLIASACVLFSDLGLGRRRFLGRRVH